MRAISARLLAFAFAFAFACSACGHDDAAHESSPDPGFRSGDPTPGADKVYVADEGVGAISVIDGATNARFAAISLRTDLGGRAVDFAPHNVQVAPDGRSVWVVGPPLAHEDEHGGSSPADADDHVFVIDPSTDAVVARIPAGRGVHLAHVVVDAASRFAWVTANASNQLLQIDVASRAIVARHDFPAACKPHGLRERGGKLFVACMDGRALAIFDPGTRAAELVPLAGTAVQVAVPPDGRHAFVSLYDTREVVRIDTATRAVVRIPLPAGAQGPIQLYASSDGRRVWVADQGLLLDRAASDKLYEIDAEAATVAATIVVGAGAHGVIVSDEDDRVYVTNTSAGTVSVVDAAGRRTVATVPVGRAPNGIAHWHVSGGMP
jgi:YVTN family beta-propeller protein